MHRAARLHFCAACALTTLFDPGRADRTLHAWALHGRAASCSLGIHRARRRARPKPHRRGRLDAAGDNDINQ